MGTARAPAGAGTASLAAACMWDGGNILRPKLLAVSRRQILQPETLDLGEVVSQVEPMLRRLIGEDILVETELATGLPCIRADRTQVLT